MNFYIDDIIGPGGVLSKRFPGYEARIGQVAMANFIDEAFANRRHALIEAPTGIGKSVAYCIPAIKHAVVDAKPCTIVTANIALQEQLFYKDLPALQTTLPYAFRFALVKGKGNYVCKWQITLGLDKVNKYFKKNERNAEEVKRIVAWAKETDTGDKTELIPAPIPIVWSALACNPEECQGCDKVSPADLLLPEDLRPVKCFANAACKKARGCAVIVTNYHMFFTSRKISKITGGRVNKLPITPHVVFDEAHEAVDIARKFFGFRLSKRSFTRFADWAKDNERSVLAYKIEDAAEAFFQYVGTVRADERWHKRRLCAPGWMLGQQAELVGYCRELQERATDCSEVGTPTERNVAAQIAERISEKLAALAMADALEDTNKIYWISTSPAIESRVLDVREILDNYVYKEAESIIGTSATLTVGKAFKYTQDHLGLPNAAELCVASPFDHAARTMLFVTTDSTDPRDTRKKDAYHQDIARACLATMQACGGRTLCLFTSNQNKDAVFELVSATNPPYRLLKQTGEDEEGPQRTELYKTFKEDETSVLFGVRSFWEGIDVPGPALTGLVIDKLPFTEPTDPVHDAICEKLEKAGKKPFFDYSLPKAVTQLRQGVGRLMRRKDDYGIIVITDMRASKHTGYGQGVLNCLPSPAYFITMNELPLLGSFLPKLSS